MTALSISRSSLLFSRGFSNCRRKNSILASTSAIRWAAAAAAARTNFSSAFETASVESNLRLPGNNCYARNFRTTSISRNIINIQDEEDFRSRVVDSALPVIVDFHATWCGPCKLLGPKLEELVGKYDGRVLMAKVDIDDNGELAMAFKVQAVPTVMALKGGKVVDGFMGLKDDDQLLTFIEKLIAA